MPIMTATAIATSIPTGIAAHPFQPCRLVNRADA